MSQNFEFEDDAKEKTMKMAWEELWEVKKKWAVMTQFEADQDWYRKMKEYYE